MLSGPSAFLFLDRDAFSTSQTSSFESLIFQRHENQNQPKSTVACFIIQSYFFISNVTVSLT